MEEARVVDGQTFMSDGSTCSAMVIHLCHLCMPGFTLELREVGLNIYTFEHAGGFP
jgi:hypothetical protein